MRRRTSHQKPYYNTLKKQTLEREQLYNRVPPPGDPIPSHIEQTPMNNKHSADQEVRRTVKKDANGRMSGASKTRTKDLEICEGRGEQGEGAGEGRGWL